ncbi:MAG: alanine--tRNA ligase [Verrucomicrobiia bacterium]
MTSSEIRQSFLDFFREKQHTIVPSSSLLPDAPNLLFTNAGMNQFVPIFLGQSKPQWNPARAVDTQKCIRAGGKHNDLEDVGLDTYHHTFFEMLGNWSFGDPDADDGIGAGYFKKEAIDWAWELLVNVWKFPKERLYATYFGGDDKTPEDKEAKEHWLRYLPADHLLPGDRKDNFWMMGDTGPCGPCSEIHVDLTPAGDTQGKLVNAGTPQCIEIWNLVFIQFNAQITKSMRLDFVQEGLVSVFPTEWKYDPLPARHVDTGMGFERVCGIIQCTKNFTDFSGVISNYESDVFTPIFRELGKLSGKRYSSTLPTGRNERGEVIAANKEEEVDLAFRVIADHIRCLSFAIADGIDPSRGDRGHVLRGILRRGVRYGRNLGFHEPFFYKLVDVLADTMGDAFPEIRKKQGRIKETLCLEEELFDKTLDAGILIFESAVRTSAEATSNATEIRTLTAELKDQAKSFVEGGGSIRSFLQENASTIAKLKQLANAISSPECLRFLGNAGNIVRSFVNQLSTNAEEKPFGNLTQVDDTMQALDLILSSAGEEELHPGAFPGKAAFLLHDTYGFPLDLTQLMARERGLTVDISEFAKLMEEQRRRARADYQSKKIAITTAGESLMAEPTEFVGYETLEAESEVISVHPSLSIEPPQGVWEGGKWIGEIVVRKTPFYPEMGGQVGDTGMIVVLDDRNAEAGRFEVEDTQKSGPAIVHAADLKSGRNPKVGERVRLTVDASRRGNIQRHHTATHLFHWALQEVVNRDARQRGSLVAPDRMRFDFNHPERLTEQQIADIERLVNERIRENAPVSWTKVPYAEIKNHPQIRQFFGEKYGDIVRVLQVGGHPGKLDGFSMELCGGTHVRNTGDIGLFKIARESAIAAGIRRVEAVVGEFALEYIEKTKSQERAEAEKAKARERQKEEERRAKSEGQKRAAELVEQVLAKTQRREGVSLVVDEIKEANAELLRAVVDVLKSKLQSGVVVLGGVSNGKVSLICYVTPDLVKQGKHAGKIVGELAKLCGGGGGGRPDLAQAGGKQPEKLAEALAAVARVISL